MTGKRPKPVVSPHRMRFSAVVTRQIDDAGQFGGLAETERKVRSPRVPDDRRRLRDWPPVRV
ncbi:hypothetical protein [Streptomyces sp. NPDC017991]|uniref:hypothetical protein n=1 Tax=Streptomyces sp. NPDC017991 TaxID=3365026 RepID=UPI0037AB36E9